jgi:hypothetical protein
MSSLARVLSKYATLAASSPGGLRRPPAPHMWILKQPRGRVALLLGVAMVCAVAPALSACGGEEEELDVVEGEPVELDGVEYTVVISRFLNPDDTEDAEYLVGEPEPGPEQLYLGVFIQVSNEGDEPAEIGDDLTVVDTRGMEYEPVASESPYALEATTLEPGDELPRPDSTAAAGPIQGAMVLFLLDERSTENRPLELEIPGPSGQTGLVELDI